MNYIEATGSAILFMRHCFLNLRQLRYDERLSHRGTINIRY